MVWVLLDTVGFGNDFGSIQLKSIMQCLEVLGYIDLMQRAALIRYCSALMIVASVSEVMQCSLVHLFLGCAYYLTMHS